MKREYGMAGILLVLALAFGGFYEFVSCIFTVVFSVCLLVQVIRNKSFQFVLNAGFLFSFVLVVGSLLTSLYGIDRGMSFLGFLKQLPLLVFSLFLMQTKKDGEEVVSYISWIGVIVLGISVLGFVIPSLHDTFIAADRLGGTFQYANTMALFFLIGMIVEQFSDQHFVRSVVMSFVLMAGILLTGSRSVFLFTIIILVISMIHNHQYIKVNGCILAVCVIAGLLYVQHSGSFQNIGRFLTISLSSSTLLGRLLYWQDALKLIGSHPFGLGYMGYYYLQGQIQTGVYTTVFVHNELLQLVLDMGWIPAIVIVYLFVRNLISKNLSLRKRIVFVTIIIHSLFDFDFQFLSIGIILLLVMDQTPLNNRTYKLSLKAVIPACVCTMLLAGYFSIPLLAQYQDNSQLALKLYPVYTEAEKSLLSTSTSETEAVKHAEKILKHNPYVTEAYDVLAASSAMHGDYGQMMTWKQEAIRNSPYQLEEYTDYLSLLSQAVSDSYAREDGEQMNRYVTEALGVETMLKRLEQRTSSLGWKIQDQPQTQLPKEYAEYVKMLRQLAEDAD